MHKYHRIFIAITLPEDIKRELTKFQAKWPELPARWIDKDNLHITLEFLGNLTGAEIAEVCKITNKIAKSVQPFSITLNKILYGPPKKMPPRMVWADGEKSEELLELKNDLQDAFLEKINYKPEGHSFTPHVTLARISEWKFKKFDIDERPEINEDLDLFFTVESVEVMESELRRNGPIYTMIESCAFKS